MGHDDNDREKRVRAAEERLRLVEETSGLGTFELDLKSGQWEWSPQLAVLFGIDRREATSSLADWERTIFADDVPKLRAAMARARQAGSFHVEFRVKHAGGAVHWLSGRGAVVSDGAGTPPRLRGAYYDITERKVLEARLLALNETLEARVAERARELAASTTRLQESEHRFGLLIDAVTDYAIFMLDPDGNVVSWNPGARRIKGYVREEILGRHFSIFYSEKDRMSGVPARALATAARTGKFEAEGWRMRRDGSAFWASVVINAISDLIRQVAGIRQDNARSDGEALH